MVIVTGADTSDGERQAKTGEVQSSRVRAPREASRNQSHVISNNRQRSGALPSSSARSGAVVR
jgi:hypothetical protein